ncbi:hypothetical protein LOK49_LG01G04217 [Camellia lanceoleosa]|uniref:Uncharacterized protein n=1 Tax=Camellia lanceoleosa TaxID=1840588 RepID=A0ACC0IUN8_9ERIC|nr:hypothetical protein LOK49_LG01G04217 [Camellia lanceoleosa]
MSKFIGFSIFGEEKALIDAVEPATTTVKEINGTVGVKIKDEETCCGAPDSNNNKKSKPQNALNKSIVSLGRGILAMDESNTTCGKRLSSIGTDNIEYISCDCFEKTLYQSTTDGKKFVNCLHEQNIVSGIKVDKGLVPLPGSNNESWWQGLDGLASRSAEYYKQGARFAKWRTVVSILCGPSVLAVKEVAWGLARYAGISLDNGLMLIMEPEILHDGEHPIERTLEVAERVWAEVFY